MDQFSRGLCLFAFTFLGLVLGFYLIIPWSQRHRQPDKKMRWLHIWAVGWIFFLLAVLSGCLAYGTAWLDWTATLAIFVCSMLWVSAFVLYLNTTLVLIPLILLFPIFWAVSMKVEDDRDSRRHSDEFLLANFQRNQAAFIQLAQMKMEDQKLEAVKADKTFISASNPQARIYRYATLLHTSGVSRIKPDRNYTGIDLEFWAVGNALSSDTEKGYAYLVKPPEQLRCSLDNISSDENHELMAYRHIQGEWYLYYHYIPG